MSLDTWKKEFYPIESWNVTKENALAHSLKKWEGLLNKNLKKHKLAKGLFCISDEHESLPIDDSSCALCHHYIFDDCVDCPLFKSLGRVCAGMGDEIYEFEHFSKYGNARPMYFALKRAMKEQK